MTTNTSLNNLQNWLSTRRNSEMLSKALIRVESIASEEVVGKFTLLFFMPGSAIIARNDNLTHVIHILLCVAITCLPLVCASIQTHFVVITNTYKYVQ